MTDTDQFGRLMQLMAESKSLENHLETTGAKMGGKKQEVEELKRRLLEAQGELTQLETDYRANYQQWETLDNEIVGTMESFLQKRRERQGKIRQFPVPPTQPGIQPQSPQFQPNPQPNPQQTGYGQPVTGQPITGQPITGQPMTGQPAYMPMQPPGQSALEQQPVQQFSQQPQPQPQTYTQQPLAPTQENGQQPAQSFQHPLMGPPSPPPTEYSFQGWTVGATS